MKANLLYIDENAASQDVIACEKELIRDLKLDILLDAMADQDHYLRDLCKDLLLSPSINKQEIFLRQQMLKEALNNNNFFVSFYRISAHDKEKTLSYEEFIHPKYDRVVSVAKRVISHVELAEIHLEFLDQLRQRILLYKPSISYQPLIDFYNEVLQKYTPDYIQGIKNILLELNCLKTNAELVLGGHPGTGIKSADVELHFISKPQKSLFRAKKSDAVVSLDTVVLINDSQEIVDSGLSWLLKTLSDFNQECNLFFDKILRMFGFYVGASNLYHILADKKVNICFPTFSAKYEHCFNNLTDIGLVLKNNSTDDIDGNTFSFLNKRLCIITGMNQGGKTTFLRSLGLAQLMSQCGLFVTADTYTCNIFNGIYTHFPNQEDKTLSKGLLEQELYQLNELVAHMKQGSLLLMNETFATTSEYDASLMAEPIISAFCRCNITTFFVTHLYEYAHKLYQTQSDDCIFLRANRSSNNGKTFELSEGAPLRSGLAIDLYHQIID